MPSEWYCFTDDEHGPYSFAELAKKVADGELRETDLVRRAESDQWQPVEGVVGLIRASKSVDKPRSGDRRSQRRVSKDSPQRVQASVAPFWKRWNRQRIVAIVAVTCVGFFIYQVTTLWLSGPEQFPDPQRVSLEQNSPNLLDQIQAPPPRSESIPGLPSREPRLVPGFDPVMWCKSPTLDHEMTSLVYVTYRGEETLDDLILASRTDVGAPFEQQELIESTVGETRESHPTLSPDGLELIYAVNSLTPGSPSKLRRVRRMSKELPFLNPEDVYIQGDPFTDLFHDAPCLINERTMIYTTYDGDYKQRSVAIAKRSNSTSGFEFVDTIPIADPWPRYAFSSHLQRAYYPSESGIFLTARHPATNQFVSPQLLISSDVLGPDLNKFDDTIWITPKEDVIFYCSPGLEPENAENHQLRMVRITE